MEKFMRATQPILRRRIVFGVTLQHQQANFRSLGGQRCVNDVAAGNPEFILCSFDVSQAFAKGMTFEESSALSGQDVRKAELDVSKADIECVRQLLDFRDFDPVKESLTMLKPIYWLKDAPRAWRKKLHQVLVQWLPCRHMYIYIYIYAEPEFYCFHRKYVAEGPDIIIRAKEHDEEQRDRPHTQYSATRI